MELRLSFFLGLKMLSVCLFLRDKLGERSALDCGDVWSSDEHVHVARAWSVDIGGRVVACMLTDLGTC